MEQRGNRKVQYLITLCVSLSTLSLGVSSAWPTLAIFKYNNNQTDMEITKDEISWMLSLSTPGFIVGGLATRFISDNLGRRATLLGSAIPTAVGTIIILFAKKAWLVYITRILWGCGTGVTSTVISMYLSEVADKEIRGTLFNYTRVATNFGSLLTMVIGPFLSYQALNSMLLLLPICYFLACLWIPESPYYYLKEGRVNAARKELKRLQKYTDEMALEDALMSMQSDVKKEMVRSSSVKELFTGKQYRKALVIAFGIKVAQIMTGTTTIQQYLSDVMTDGNVQLQFSTVTIIFGAANFIVGMMTSVLVDRVGRRPLLLYSYLLIGIIFINVGIYFFFKEIMLVAKEVLSPYAILIFIGLIMSSIISNLGFNSVIFIISAEIFPMNVKAVALTTLSVLGGILGFTVSRGYQIIKDCLGLFLVFSVLGSVGLFGALFVYFVVPETRGMSLKEIQVMLRGGIDDEDDDMTKDRINGECKEMKELNPKGSGVV